MTTIKIRDIFVAAMLASFLGNSYLLWRMDMKLSYLVHTVQEIRTNATTTTR